MKVITESLFQLPEVEVSERKTKVPATLIGVFQDEIKDSPYIKEISRKFPIYDKLEKAGFKGKGGDFFDIDISPDEKIAFVGLGKKDEKNQIKKENIRRASALGLVNLRSKGFDTAQILGFENYEREALEGAFLGLYEFRKYKNMKEQESKEKGSNDDTESEKKKDIKKIYLITEKKVDELVSYVRVLCEAQNFARDIVNEPGNVINPLTLSEIASAIAEKYGLGCVIFDIEEIKKMGMGGVVAVGQGSAIPPKFVHLWWKPDKKPKDKVAFIGKAITFDSGGLSLKPPQSMVTMKSDKSGACAVVAAMKVIAQIKPDVEIHGIFAACENMPSGTAQRPDDIIKIMDGKTVEVVNTDAEGRLTLVDAIVFASRLGVSKIVDLATLTGACIVALGEYTAGVMGNSEDFAWFICNLGRQLGEKMWILPFDKDLDEKLKSDFAFVKNVGDGYGGAVTAGMFMEKFVPENIEWVHLDIAGPAFLTKKVGYFQAKGGTGFGVRTLVELARRLEKGEYSSSKNRKDKNQKSKNG
jgi:leucyl aminopeptidase